MLFCAQGMGQSSGKRGSEIPQIPIIIIKGMAQTDGVLNVQAIEFCLFVF